MTADWPILSAIIWLPILGGALVLGSGDRAPNVSRWLALIFAVLTFLVSIPLYTGFDPSTAQMQFIEKTPWIPAFDVYYYLGVDGISMPLILLTTFISILVIIAGWEVIQYKPSQYMAAFLIMEGVMVGVFAALDAMLFYVFWEAMLIPMFIIIGVWGGARRVYAAFKFFLYTLLGSVLMLLAILAIYFDAGTTDIPTLLQHRLPAEMQIWLWLAFFASFAVKVPMWPVHTWLPDAHVEAPTAGSVILAGVLLKMGGYGFLRFSVPMMPYGTEFFTPLIFTLSVVAIIYTSLVALAQEDMKKLIAYSSVAHMGYVTVGIFTLNVQGMQGAIFQMLSHGIVSAALFLLVGVIYDRLHTRMIDRYGGLADQMPHYALTFMIFMLASVGLPLTGGFIGEFLVIVGAFQVNTWVALLTASGMVLGAAYMLYLYRQVIFGSLTKRDLMSLLDMNWREKLIFAPLILLTFWMGIYPEPLLNVMEASVVNIIENYQLALDERAGVSLAELMPGR